MFDPAQVPDVTLDEIVARYLMFSKWVRADQTIKHDAFMPPEDLELSVTRHRNATAAELWQARAQVATERGRTFYGRADVVVGAFVGQRLQVGSDPVPGNPNHAKVTGWPTSKSEQMLIAKKSAATPGLCRIPLPVAASSATVSTSAPVGSGGNVAAKRAAAPPPTASPTGSRWSWFLAAIWRYLTRR